MHETEVPLMDRPVTVRERNSACGDGYLFISRFDPKHDEIPCWGYDVLHHAKGCRGQCSYCYLVGVLRKKTSPTYYDNYDDMVSEIKRWMVERAAPTILHCGSLADSLMISTEYLEHILPLFFSQKKTRHTLVLVTKGVHEAEKLKIFHKLASKYSVEARSRVITIFSLNAPDVSMMYELGTPSVGIRLRQAAELYSLGYRVRFRIDPMIPVEHWKAQYRQLIWMISQTVKGIKPSANFGGKAVWVSGRAVKNWSAFTQAHPFPERITMGALRGNPGLIGICKERGWPYELDPTTKLKDGKLRISDSLRSRMFTFVALHARRELPHAGLSLCKESREMCRSYSPHQQCVCLP